MWNLIVSIHKVEPNVCAVSRWKWISCQRKRTNHLHPLQSLHLKIQCFLSYVLYRVTQEPYDTDLMAKDFLMQFSGLALTIGQPLVFQFQDKKLLGLSVKALEAVDPAAAISDKAEPKATVFGRLLGNSTVQFEKAEMSSVNLVGKSKGWVRSNDKAKLPWNNFFFTRFR